MGSDQKQVRWPGWDTVSKLGSGNYGAVYEIRRDVLGTVERAALKVVRIPREPGDVAELYNDGYDEQSVTAVLDGYLKDIVSEYALMRKLRDCGNIVSCDDIEAKRAADGVGWYVYIKMELLTPLVSALPQDQIPEETVIAVAKDICRALVACEKEKVVHRDIKPQNILMSESGDYKLGDFGIAKTIEKSMGNTVIGTYRYMAPEVHDNKPYGHKADIYSLGLVLYWMLNRRRLPFMPLPPQQLNAGDDERARSRRFGGEALPPPVDGSQWLKNVVLKACAYDPADRFDSAAQMLAALEAQEDPLEGTMCLWDFGRSGQQGGQQSQQSQQSQQRQYQQEQPVPPPKPKKPCVWWRYLVLGVAALVLVAVVLLLLLKGCQSQADGPGGKTTVPQTSQQEPTEHYQIALNTEKLGLFLGGKAELVVSGIPEDAVVHWESSDGSVVTVDQEGLVRGAAVGSATITVSWDMDGQTQSAQAQITVAESGITLDAYVIDPLFVGQTHQLTAQTAPAGRQVSWHSSNAAVVKVTADGLVTAVGSGTAQIIAGFGDWSASCNVVVVQPMVALDQERLSLELGESVTLSATAIPEDAQLHWSSDDASIAKVVDGKVTAMAVGSTTIRVEMEHLQTKYEAVCQIDVFPQETVPTDPPETKPSQTKPTQTQPTQTQPTETKPAVKPEVTLDRQSVSVIVGQETTVYATVKPSGSKVTWSSSDSSVAKVSGGKITAVSEGSATITASISTGGKTYKASCTVRVSEPTITVTSSSGTIEFSQRDDGTCTVSAKVDPDGGDIRWSSSDGSIASVNGSGKTATVTAKAVGSVTITATYQFGGTTVTDSCTLEVRKAASILDIEGFDYTPTGTVQSFQVYGTIYSNYSLVRCECKGYVRSNALGINVTNEGDVFEFPDNVFSYEAKDLRDWLMAQYDGLYNTYASLANLIGADNSVTVVLTCTIYDSSGNSNSRDLTYVIYDD